MIPLQKVHLLLLVTRALSDQGFADEAPEVRAKPGVVVLPRNMAFSANPPCDLWRRSQDAAVAADHSEQCTVGRSAPRPPLTVMPVVAATVAAATEFTFKLLLVVSAFCFAAIVVVMSVPSRYSGPVIRALLLQAMLPDTSKNGALTGHENTAVLLMPSRSTLFESAKLNVPEAGLIRAQVRLLNVTDDELVSNAFFPASTSVSPTTSASCT